MEDISGRLVRPFSLHARKTKRGSRTSTSSFSSYAIDCLAGFAMVAILAAALHEC